ncbi:MAG: flagellar motor protein MotB [Candidatus Cloacimonetes bacterium]|jgi:chemotaxis protein MotB|nr:flagellar motor protein MotB [Candidatus Cloacimonadota bacterium]MBT4575450.1 flagellar motor protein MotB [Candidatus Cloacimonadota bacterium]
MKKKDLYQSVDEELIFDDLGETDESRKVGASGNLSFDVMLPYADLMSLLLVFFVFFFIISDFKKGQAIAEKNELIVQKARLDSLLKRNEEVITIPSEILFQSGKAELDINAKVGLEKVGHKIAGMISDGDTWDIRIEGHTDDVPIISGKYASNWELSTARAVRIVKFFMENQFFPPDQMQAMGYGEFKPIAPNDTIENRTLNRRVEIKVSKKYK